MTPEPLQDDFWGAWAAYLAHVVSCDPCQAVESVGEGCEEGRRLYGNYRLAKINRGSTVSS